MGINRNETHPSAKSSRTSASSTSHASSAETTTASSLLHLAMLTSLVAAAVMTTGVADASSVSEHNDERKSALPYCSDVNLQRTVGRRLLYVSTLDGRLAALDIGKSGKLRWSIPTGPGPLLSSSIHRLELTNNGQFVRMIPSLSGGIYKFDGEYIDPIPITTDNLLSSSAKFSDDLVISGGKETRTYGVSARTGQLLYECSMHGCVNETDALNATNIAARSEKGEDGQQDRVEPGNPGSDHDPLTDEVIVVRRQTQTVRAVETRSGVERWNFSVGQHELNLIKSAECHDREFSEMDMAILDLDVKVIVPEGVICAFSKAEPSLLLWKHKFDHPIVGAWKISETDELESIDIFSSAQWLWDDDENLFEAPYPSVSPTIYLGMYEKQLYIQESVSLRNEILGQSNLYNHFTAIESKLPKIPWRPVAASSNSLVIFHDDKVIEGGTLPRSSEDLNLNIQGNELIPYNEDNFAISAQSVLNGSEFVNGNGFYLYMSEDFNKSVTKALCDTESEVVADIATNRTVSDDLRFNVDDIDAPVKVVILSLWFWWKEIVVIAITSAVLLNLFIGHRQRPEREIVVIERHIPVPTAMEATEASTVALLGPVVTNGTTKSNSNGFSAHSLRTLSESTSQSGEHFSSRFQEDFDLVRCLGRGGFGVVFEAKNKLDDCKYAVKRITLPNKKESRERVMREVKTLANCEHQNIVRYFQAWVETPPPGWQEEEDNKLLAHEMSTSIQIETPDGSTLPSFVHDVNQLKGRLQVEKKKQLLSWVSSVASTACSSDQDCDGLSRLKELDEEDDSCIVFRTESQSRALRENDDDSATSKSSTNEEQRKLNGSVSIDIHSKSFNFSSHTNSKNFDYTQLSDSFQIEFVRSANGEVNSVDAAAEPRNGSKCASKRPQTLKLHQEHNSRNNCKALLPVLATGPVKTPETRPPQNKVYLYIQMQLCRKESLRDWLRENKREMREPHIGSIFYQIVDAVDYVHFKGLIHRDLKPSNIFFSQDGQIKIGDFGLVTDMSDIPNMVTRCGDTTGLPSCSRHTQQVGTHLYMSPEQLRGQHYDFKVDIYSLGLIFFELLVYFATEMERMKTLRDLRVGCYPHQFADSHPAEYDLLKQMLSAQPEVRPPTSDLKLQLNSILKMPEPVEDSGLATLAAAVRRLSRSRTFSSTE